MRHWMFLTAIALGHAQDSRTELPAYVEGERKAYDQIYTSQRETFLAKPNAFLVRTIQGRRPGRALDVAMGQGRNALWLAANGWDVTGFDISEKGVAEARAEAARRGLKIDAVVAAYEQFDWGKGSIGGKPGWDLVVFSYFLPKAALPKVWDALRPGGLIVVEGFHADTGRIRPIGGGYHDNELFRVFDRYRILVYEDVEDRQDWGREHGATNRLVRVLAQKSAPLPPGCSWQGKNYKTGESICWGAKWSCGLNGWEWAGKCPG